MNKYKCVISALLLCMTSMADAQHTFTGTAPETVQESAVKMLADGHYYAAKLSLSGYLDNATTDMKFVKEAEALRLVCDYALRTAGTADAIGDWLNKNPSSPYNDVLRTLQGNLLVMEERYEEVDELDFRPFQYPVSLLQEESKLYCSILYIHRGEYNRAESLLNELRDNDIYYIDADYYLSYIKYVKGDFKGAYSGFAGTATTPKYKSNASMYAADCCVRVGNPNKALDFLRDVNVTEENSDDVNRIYGEAYFGLAKYSNAVKYFAKTSGENRTALYKEGLSYMHLKQYENATEALNKCVGNYNDAMSESALLNAGNAYLKLQRKRQAQMAFQRAVKINADAAISEEAAYNLALTYHDGAPLGFGESVTAFEGFLNKYPKSKYRSAVSRHLTEVYFTTKNYSSALASINKIKQPNNEILNAKQRVLYNLAIQSFNASDYANAKSYVTRAISMGSLDEESFSESYFIKGESEFRMGDYKNAANDLIQFTNIAPTTTKNYAYASYSIAYTYFKQKDYSSALNHFTKYVNNPMQGDESDAQILADAYNRIGDCYMSRRNYSEANAYYQKAVKTSPANGDYSLYQQAYIAGLQGNYNKKVELLDNMSKSYSSSVYSADALYEKGRSYVQTGNKKGAAEAFTAIINEYPQSMNARKAYNELAMIQYESGETDAAAKSYLRVIQDYPNTVEAQTALANLRDIYVNQGKVNEYKALAAKAGKPLSQSELETMLHDAAIKAVTKKDYVAAQNYYGQLKAQTSSESLRLEAQVGEARAAYAANDYAATVTLVTAILADGSKVSPEKQSEFRMARAESYFAQKAVKKAVEDLNILAKDEQTVYGAQATVRLAQYYYETRQYESAENTLLKFIDSGTPHTYWLARAFVLLSDVCTKQGRDVEAQQYLLSLQSNYTENEEINKMIEERLK